MPVKSDTMPASSSFFDRLFVSFCRLPLRFPWLTLLFFIGLSVASGYYTAGHLGINTNTNDLLSKDLPFVKIRAELDRAFPQDAAAIILVVEAEQPEQAALAAGFVQRSVSANRELFQSAYIPTDNAYFRQQGLLYLSLPDLEALADKLVNAQPFIGYLSAHYSFAGLMDIIGLALEGKEQDLVMPLDPLLTAIGQALTQVKAGQAHFVSWQQLLTEDSFGGEQNRRLVIVKPRLDYAQLLPAALPMANLRELAVQLAQRFPGATLSVTGEIALEHEEMETVNQGMLWSSIVSLFLVCLTLYVGFRSFRLLLVTFVALLAGLALTAGFAALAVGHLNLISIAFAVLYIGLGVDFATHLCLRYQECRQQGMEVDGAIADSMHSVGASLFLCAATTAIGFLAFVPTDFKGVSELGIISGAGIFIGLAVSLSMLPAMLKLLPGKNRQHRAVKPLPDWIYRFPFRYRRPIQIAALLVAVAGGLTLTRLSFDSNPINLRDPNTQSVTAFKKLLRSQTDSPFATSALADSLPEADALAAKFRKLPSVHEALTLSNLLPEQQDEKLDVIDNLNLIMPGQLQRFAAAPEPSDVRAALLKLAGILTKLGEQAGGAPSAPLWLSLREDIQGFVGAADASANPAQLYAALQHSVLHLLPQTMSMLRDGLSAQAVGIDDIPDPVRAQWLGTDGRYRVLVLPEQDLNDAEHLKAFVSDIMQTFPNSFGLPIGDVTSGQAVVEAFIQAFSAALGMIVLLLLILTRSFKSTLLIVLPLLLAAILTGACNVLLQNPFNFANIIVLPLLLGMGVDSGIHIVYRLQHADSDQHALLESSSARGVFYSALTTLCSFSSLAFNSHNGTASMGLLLSLGISFTILCSLLVVPAFSGMRAQN